MASRAPLEALRARIEALRQAAPRDNSPSNLNGSSTLSDSAALEQLVRRIRTASVDAKASAAKLNRERRSLIADLQAHDALSDAAVSAATNGASAPPEDWPWTALCHAALGDSSAPPALFKPTVPASPNKQQQQQQQQPPPSSSSPPPSCSPAAFGWARRAASEQASAVFTTLISPLRSMSLAMLDPDVISSFARDGSRPQQQAHRNSSSVSTSGLHSAAAVDVWTAFADVWKDAGFVANLMLLADVPRCIAPAAGTPHASELLPLMASCVGSALVALQAVLVTSCPKLVKLECLHAIGSIAQGLVGSGWRTLACRLDRRLHSPATVESEALHSTTLEAQSVFTAAPPSCFASVDVGALIALHLLSSAAQAISHLDLEAFGDDSESAVSLTGTREPAARAAEAVDSLRGMIDSLMPTAAAAIVQSIGQFFQYMIGADYLSQKWLTHPPFFGDKVASHALRYTFVHLHMHWLGPLNHTLQLLDFVSAGAPATMGGRPLTWFDTRGTRTAIASIVIYAVVCEWRSLLTSVRATSSRTKQLKIDTLYLVRFVRTVRAWYEQDAAASQRIETALLETVASVSLRASPFVETVAKLCRAVKREVPPAVAATVEAAEAAAATEATPADEAAAVAEAARRERDENAFWSSGAVWDTPLPDSCVGAAEGHANAVSAHSPLHYFSFNVKSSPEAAMPIEHAELTAIALPSPFAPIPAHVFAVGSPTEKVSGSRTLFDVLRASTFDVDAFDTAARCRVLDAPACVNALALRWELWSDYPALEEDDELEAAACLKHILGIPLPAPSAGASTT